MVVVIAVAVGIIYYYFQQLSPAIRNSTADIRTYESSIRFAREGRMGERMSPEGVSKYVLENERLLVPAKDRLRMEYLKLVGGSTATIIIAFFVIHYLTSAKGRE